MFQATGFMLPGFLLPGNPMTFNSGIWTSVDLTPGYGMVRVSYPQLIDDFRLYADICVAFCWKGELNDHNS